VPQACWVDIDPAGRIGERADLDEVGRALQRRDVDHVEPLADFGDGPVGGRCREDGRLGRPIDCRQVMLEADLYAILRDRTLQRRDEERHAEQDIPCYRAVQR